VEIRLDREAGPAGPQAVLTVRDPGIGIPAADLPRVFEQFHRADNVAERIPGAGIGLTSAAQIIAAHGGTIAVESQEGVGSTFTARLPLQPPSA
jgi:signal transduction histidine kinase